MKSKKQKNKLTTNKIKYSNVFYKFKGGKLLF